MGAGGVMVWIVHKYLPINAKIKTLFNIVVAIIVWVLAYKVLVSCLI
jgi:hypothetical protein